MKFLKLRLHHVPGEGTVERWMLVIDNDNDLLKFHNIDVERYMYEFLNMDTGRHAAANTRQGAIETFLHTRIATAPEDTKVYPIVEIARLLDMKAMGMYKCMQRGPICINEAGGYCYLDSFMNTWKAEIVEEINKSDIGFPVDKEALVADFLVLENSPEMAYGVKQYLNENNISNYAFINNLKEKDMSYVFKSIQNAKEIILQSQFLDEDQIDSFIKTFIPIKRKKIVILTHESCINRLKSHPLFSAAELQHNIVIKIL